MPRNKDLKRLVRARMTKTGEAYTAARAQILKKRPAITPMPPRAPYAELAGITDRAVKERTGCTWERWVPMLDGLGAAAMRHGEIARLVQNKFKVDGWSSQMVTVGYERIKGRRAVGQRLDGFYEVSKSKTFNVPVATLFDAWATPRQRRKWLDAPVTVRTATKPKSMRLGWKDRTIVAVWFEPKGAGKSTVSLAHTKLPDKGASTHVKQYWSERLDALGEMLTG
jgi:hypothetical protein